MGLLCSALWAAMLLSLSLLFAADCARYRYFSYGGLNDRLRTLAAECCNDIGAKLK